MKEFNAKKKTALLAVNILLSILLVMSMCVTVALAVTQFSLNMGGNISFQAKDVQATISEGVVANGTGGENKMKEITLTPDNDGSAEISSWSGLEILFAGKEDVTITFTVTNNHTEEMLMFSADLKEGTKDNMTMLMTIDGEEKTEVIIPANMNSNDNSVECIVRFHITDSTKSASLTDFAINCNLETTDEEYLNRVTIILDGHDNNGWCGNGYCSCSLGNLEIKVNGGEIQHYSDITEGATEFPYSVYFYDVDYIEIGNWKGLESRMPGFNTYDLKVVVNDKDVDVLSSFESVRVDITEKETIIKLSDEDGVGGS